MTMQAWSQGDLLTTPPATRDQLRRIRRRPRLTTSVAARVVAGTVVGVLVSSFNPAHAADSPSAWTQGNIWNDGLDTRLQATSIANAATRSGYTSSTTLGAVTDLNWFDHARNEQVVAFFGHGNKGLFAPQDNPKPFLYSGCVDCYSHQVPPPGQRASVNVSSYLPTEIDDIRLLIWSTCYGSQRVSDRHYSLPEVARLRGVDSVIAFDDIVYSPTSTPGTPVANTNYSGGYFWSRAGAHLGGGKPLSQSVRQSMSDLYAKEGSYAGYNRYVIDGAAAAPGDVTLRSSAESQPTSGIDPVSVSRWVQEYTGLSLPPADPATGLNEVQLVPGTYARFSPTGRLFDVAASGTTSGPTTVDRAAAASSIASLLREVGSLPAAAVSSDQLAEVSQVRGEKLWRFTWTSPVGSQPRRHVQADIDQRTGDLVYFLDTTGRATSPGSTVTSSAAEAAVLNAFPDNVMTNTDLDTWSEPTWTISTQSRDGAVRYRHEVDARSGALLRTSMATVRMSG